MTQYRFHNTGHSIAREGLRELSSESVRAVIRSPDHRVRLRSGQHRGTVFSFEKSVEGATLKVIAEIRDQDVWIITAYEKD